MGRLGLVTAAGGRGWRVYAGPVCLLLGATLAIGLLRGQLRDHAAPPRAKTVVHVRSPLRPSQGPASYLVRAGDTLGAIAARTRVPVGRLLTLNPRVVPTALFIGERLRLR
jgi:LysM repeat protein